jgi:glycosyltransferase involved in cell wall biosynthesis
MKDISVVVCTLNAERIIEECLKSVKDNNPLEIILVDGRSKDRTVELAKPYVDKVIFDNGEGLGAARNLGLDAAKGAYIAFVGPDNVMPPGSLNELKSYLIKKQCAMVCPRTLLKDTSSYIGWAQNRYREKYTPGYKSVVGTPMFAKREVLASYKFDPKMTWSDDTDVCERMNQDGYQFAITTGICYEIGSSGFKDVQHRWIMYGEGDRVFYKKYAPQWSVGRKIKSVLHPFRTEIITTLKEIGFWKWFTILPFLCMVMTLRYYGWLKALRKF